MILGVKVMLKITAMILSIELFSRAIVTNLLSFPYSEYIWYITWAILALFLMYLILRETKAHPNLQKITVPIAFLVLVVVFIEMARYLERNFTDYEIVKSVYGVGSMAVNWLIVAYLFAPIALLLVKSIKSRYSA